MAEERLQKILARAGYASRRKAEEVIREGLVTVNGRVAEIGDKADPQRDAIKVGGKRIQAHTGPYHYLLLNKPKGVMSTVSDPEERQTVMDFVPPTLRKALVPVGRLDFHTEGLIVLTDDGEFAQRLAHPRHGSRKTYEVKVKGRPEEADLDKLREGIVLEGRRTAPAKIAPRRGVAKSQRRRGDPDSENSWWTVELVEGRTRQIREMFQRIGNPVLKLRRVAIGSLRDPHLQPGSMRELTPDEVERLLEKPSRKPEKMVRKAGWAAPKGSTERPAKKAAGKKAEGEEKPAAKKPAARKPAAKKPAAKKPAARKPAAKKPAARKPAARGPEAREPSARKPAARKPAGKAAAPKRPSARKPAGKAPAKPGRPSRPAGRGGSPGGKGRGR